MTALGKEVMTLLAQLQLAKIKDGAEDAVLDELDGYMQAARELGRETKPRGCGFTIPTGEEVERAVKTFDGQDGNGDPGWSLNPPTEPPAGQGFGALFTNPNGKLQGEGDQV